MNQVNQDEKPLTELVGILSRDGRSIYYATIQGRIVERLSYKGIFDQLHKAYHSGQRVGA